MYIYTYFDLFFFLSPALSNRIKSVIVSTVSVKSKEERRGEERNLGGKSKISKEDLCPSFSR